MAVDLGRRVHRGREIDAVVLADVPDGTVSDLLARRAGVSGGEAATVLLAVARGVGALHTAGWSGPVLSPDGVLFTADGCPALDLLDDVVPSTGEAAVADAEAFHAFARILCLRVVDGTGLRLLAAVEGALRTGRWAAVEEAVSAVARPVAVRLGADGAASRGGSADGPDATAVVAGVGVAGGSTPVGAEGADQGVAGWSAALATRGRGRGGRRDSARAASVGSAGRQRRHLVRDTAGASESAAVAGRESGSVDGRSVRSPVGLAPRRGLTPDRPDPHSAAPRGTIGSARTADLVELLDRGIVRAARAWLVGLVRRRPALTVAAAVPLALAVVLIATIPGNPPDSASAASAAFGRSGGSAGTGRSDAGGTAVDRSGVSDGRSSAGESVSPAASPTASRSPDAVAEATGTAASRAPLPAPGTAAPRQSGDDPVDAARALLDARLACFSATPTEASCLGGVLEPRTGLGTDELAALGRAGAPAERDYTGATFALVERWGDAALIAVAPDTSRTPKSEPASLLLVRSEAGWRLRAVFP
ncbi:hypothetical protein DOE76_12685 [Leifsonia sp. ku-ls]|nr:hypothetical protein DOE76_12685 [Leifsonia sp. ku-ls]